MVVEFRNALKTYIRSTKLRIDRIPFWNERINRSMSTDQPFQLAIYDIDHDTWNYIQSMSYQILLAKLQKDCSIIDVGCGYGALVECLPETYNVTYTGLDIVPKFIKEAQRRYPKHRFIREDWRNFVPDPHQPYDFVG